jgi:hypothetical protein
MIFTSVSIDQVISRVIRNTRLQDTSYIPDMMEWIPEAMGQMKTRMPLSYMYADVEISFHKGKMPCGLYYLLAVEYQGRRLGTSSTVKNYLTGHVINDKNKDTDASTTDLFTSVIQTNPNDTYFDQNNLQWSSTFTPMNNPEVVMKCDRHPSHWYQIEMDWLTSSIVDGTVRVHYYSQPLDENGMPLIPDNENYKEALYCYVRAKMIGAGYQDTMREEDLMQRFETYARRAINEITYPTPDQKEQQYKTQVRLIPPANYYENFFRVDEHEKPY